MKTKLLLTALVSSALLNVVTAQENQVPAKGLALFSKDGKFTPYEFKRHAMFGDARRGKVNQNPPPKMSRIYREDRSMEVVVHKRSFLAQVCLTTA